MNFVKLRQMGQTEKAIGQDIWFSDDMVQNEPFF